MYHKCQTQGDIFERLCRALAAGSRDVRGSSADFAALSSNSARVDFAYDLVRSFGLFPEVVGSLKGRDSVRLRQEGNQLFKLKKDELALEKYTQSVACAPAGSEDLALAYANRSAVLFEHKLYKECLEDIGRAFSNNYPQHLHEKLLQRRERAESSRAIQPQIHYHNEPPALTYGPSRGIQCAGDCVEVKFQKNLGRHVVASRDVAVGDVVALEEPFAKILLKEHYSTHCHECLRPCYNLIPCNSCSLAMFCGESCKANSCHKYECPILPTLLELDVNKLTLVALKICMCAKDAKDEGSADALYRSKNYHEIHNLIANTDARSSADLFERAVTAAVIFELVQKYTDLFLEADKDAFKERLLLHMQTGPSNFHEISELVRTDEGFYGVEEIGAGAYAFLSLLNHSCCPNVVRHCHGSAIVLRALRPIRMGEQLFDNYGYHHAVMTGDERRLHLKKQYYFECNCEACSKKWPLYHDLPINNFDVGVTEEQITDLRNGNAQVAETCLENLQKAASVLEESRPCRELADVQEILKQCYAIFANKRPVL